MSCSPRWPRRCCDEKMETIRATGADGRGGAEPRLHAAIALRRAAVWRAGARDAPDGPARRGRRVIADPAGARSPILRRSSAPDACRRPPAVARWAIDGVVPESSSGQRTPSRSPPCSGSAGRPARRSFRGAAAPRCRSATCPRAVDVVLLTDRLSRVMDHDHSNLTVTVEAGITLGDLDRTLADAAAVPAARAAARRGRDGRRRRGGRT